MMSAEDQTLLKLSLEVAVPLWIAKLQKRSWDYVQERSRECGQIVAEKGDVLQFKTKGETAKAFNALAEGIACAAFVPGGLKILGLHFEAEHPSTPKKHKPKRTPV